MAQTRKAGTAKHSRPNFLLEDEARLTLGADAIVFGVDEVGRGPFAGPVVAGAAWLSGAAAEQLAAQGLDDSKRLTPRMKKQLSEALADLCAERKARVALGAASVPEIDALNIGKATGLAMRRAVARLSRMGFDGRAPDLALVDGKHPPTFDYPIRMVIGGDGRSLSIAAGALAAKMARDKLMRRLALRYPAYGWHTNVGYGGAKVHRQAILSHGLTPHHRRAFCRNLLATKTQQ